MRAGSGELRIGMIGAGTMAARPQHGPRRTSPQLYPDLAMRPRLVAVADVNADARDRARRALRLRARRDATGASLVAADDVDLVVACLPPRLQPRGRPGARPRPASTSCARSRSAASADSRGRDARAPARRPACSTAWQPATAGRPRSGRSRKLDPRRGAGHDPEPARLVHARLRGRPGGPAPVAVPEGARRRRDRHRHRLPPRRLRPVPRRRDRDGPGAVARRSSPNAPLPGADAVGNRGGDGGAAATGARDRAGRRRGRGRRARHLRRRGLRRPRDEPRGDRQARVAPDRGLRLARLGRLGPRAARRVPGLPARRPVHLRVPAGPREPGPPGRRRAAHRRDRRDLDRLARPGMRDVGRVPRRDRRGPSRLGRLQRRRPRQRGHRCALCGGRERDAGRRSRCRPGSDGTDGRRP